MELLPGLLYPTKSEQLELLRQVLRFDGVLTEDLPVDEDELDMKSRKQVGSKRAKISVNKITGGSDFTYLEYATPVKHSLFRKRDRALSGKK
jgi:hypothetical protein